MLSFGIESLGVSGFHAPGFSAAR